ncbi:hypothetical protein ACFL0W_03160 [Nanoarchaeota archaeon]
MKNQVFAPTVARFRDDIITSLAVQEPLVEIDYKQGLMLVIQNGVSGLSRPSALEQYHNLRGLDGNYGDSAIVTMLSNIPIGEIDFLHNAEYATEHVKRGVDFTRYLPIGSRKILTFHLNTLVSEEEFREQDRNYWRNKFNSDVRPYLENLADYALRNGVEVKVETVPVPEFGDIKSEDERTYEGVKLNLLRNPFYLTGMWGFDQLHDAGLGICLDLCHNRTIYEIVANGDSDKVLHELDRTELAIRTLMDDVEALEPTDLVHLNDGSGLYNGSKGSVHREGVALGQGDIRNLGEIILYLDEHRIPFVLEINETNFENRPETRASVDYLLNI